MGFFISALKNAFEDIDFTSTGRINKSELRSALQLTGQNPTAEEMTTYTERLGNTRTLLKQLITVFRLDNRDFLFRHYPRCTMTR